MKTTKYILCLAILLLVHPCFGQIDVREDIYVLRSDVALNYNLFVRNNDTPFAEVKIFGLQKIGNSANQYTAAIIDSNYILIASSTADTFSGQLRYKGRDNSGNIDSTNVFFTRVDITPSMRPGDANKDNVVNHLDIFLIGIHYEKRGESRHNADTNIDFNTPKRISDWSFSAASINAKYADIDGNSVINQNDFVKLKLNLGNSAGAYNPRLSDSNSTNAIQLNIQDTVLIGTLDSNKVKIPIRLSKTASTPSYGLGFSLSVQNLAETSGQDTFYPKYQYIPPSDKSLWPGISQNNILFLEDKISKPNFTNIAYCKTSKSNADIKDDIGVVEIIVDEILIGQTDKEKYNRLFIHIKEIAWIDNNYNTLSIKPISKYLYFKKATASISSLSRKNVKIYPTLVDDYFVLEGLTSKRTDYVIINSLGQTIHQGTLINKHDRIQTYLWPSGHYYLKLLDSEQSFKIFKK